jgi:hypothetical protein
VLQSGSNRLDWKYLTARTKPFVAIPAWLNIFGFGKELTLIGNTPTKLDRFAKDKRSSLFGLFVGGEEEKKVLQH